MPKRSSITIADMLDLDGDSYSDLSMQAKGLLVKQLAHMDKIVAKRPLRAIEANALIAMAKYLSNMAEAEQEYLSKLDPKTLRRIANRKYNRTYHQKHPEIIKANREKRWATHKAKQKEITTISATLPTITTTND